MNTVEVTITCHFLSEQQKDLLKVFGFTSDGQHIYKKEYESDSTLQAIQLLHHVLKEMNIDPYLIECSKKYFDDALDKTDNMVYSYV
jgi:hypothetical protein